mmetsp:Transcript_51445/g.135761  ORF Transcript_51445/g.135761 Transcript_51445/m.135761 type:complete len:224 (-) Transcript_51445:123-794(-)
MNPRTTSGVMLAMLSSWQCMGRPRVLPGYAAWCRSSVISWEGLRSRLSRATKTPWHASAISSGSSNGAVTLAIIRGTTVPAASRRHSAWYSMCSRLLWHTALTPRASSSFAVSKWPFISEDLQAMSSVMCDTPQFCSVSKALPASTNNPNKAVTPPLSTVTTRIPFSSTENCRSGGGRLVAHPASGTAGWSMGKSLILLPVSAARRLGGELEDSSSGEYLTCR